MRLVRGILGNDETSRPTAVDRLATFHTSSLSFLPASASFFPKSTTILNFMPMGGTLYKSQQVIMLNGCFRDHQITDRDPRNQGSRCASTDHEIDPFTLVDGMLRLESSLSFAMPAESERDS